MSFGICAIVFNEEKYIEEWIAFHLLQGVARILLYDDGSTDSTTQIIIDLSVRYPVELVTDARRSASFDLHQRAVYKDATWRLFRMEFVAFIDVDEFIFCSSGKTFAEELARIPNDVSAIALNQRVFGSSGNRCWHPGLVISRFQRSTAVDHPENRWFKTIARPQRIIGFDSVHSVQLHFGRYLLNDGRPLKRSGESLGCADDIGSGTLCLNHYMLKSLEEFKIKQAKATHNGLTSRYSDDYFLGRDTEHWANAVENSCLSSVSKVVQAKVDDLRAVNVKRAPFQVMYDDHS